MKTLYLNLAENYPIYIENNLLDSALLKECCLKLNKRPVIITDSNLVNLGKRLKDTLQEQGLISELLVFPAGEIHKTRETKQLLEDELLTRQYGRDTCLIALGGGVVSDLVGFIGATYCREIPVIYIPTTLLAMVDASIGGKTAVNTPYGKNLIGTFTQPHAVFIDTNTLKTLPKREWHNGMAEIIKHSMIADADLFYMLQSNSAKIKNHDFALLIDIIYRNCLIKKNIVEQDEKEQGIRKLLNFGHTIGHAIEKIENYNISHGEAIAIGMLVETQLSIQHGYLNPDTLAILDKILKDYGLPLKTRAFQNKDILRKTLMLDKKAINNTPYFVLLDEIGKPHNHNGYCVSLDSIYLENALNWAAENFAM